jgi:hypothetical protein
LPQAFRLFPDHAGIGEESRPHHQKLRWQRAEAGLVVDGVEEFIRHPRRHICSDRSVGAEAACLIGDGTFGEVERDNIESLSKHGLGLWASTRAGYQDAARGQLPGGAPGREGGISPRSHGVRLSRKRLSQNSFVSSVT